MKLPWQSKPPPPPHPPSRIVLADDEPTNHGYTSLTGTLRPPWHAHRDALQSALTLAEQNPLAHRIISLTTDYALGGGPAITDPWLAAFWHHPLNHMPTRLPQWSDALAIQGELYIVLSTNPVDRMTYVRTLPAITIDEIETDPDDLEHELSYHQLTDTPEGRTWPAADPASTEQAILHFTTNKPIGDVRGRSDLLTIADWLDHYDTWLLDRVRLNRHRSSHLWHVSIESTDPNAIAAARARYRTPPPAGSIIVSANTETWEALHPNIAADDAQADGHALRMIIAAGAGLPLHYLAEPGDANRATAEAMNEPTLRRLQRRQAEIEYILNTVTAHAAARARRVVPPIALPDLHPPAQPTEARNDE